MINIQNLYFSYNGARVLNDVNLSISADKITGILGPNGSGKSTLLKLLSGYLKSDGGGVYIDGKNINEIPSRQKNKTISFVAQNYNFSFPYTCYEFIMMGRFSYLNYLGFEKKEDIEIVNDVMGLTNTTYLKNRFISTLSGGEAQRVLIAQALASRAKILLLDEPVNHLDIKYQIEILDLIKKLNKENNMTIIMVIHDLNLALMYCDEIALLKNGAVFSQGAPNETLTRDNIFTVFDASIKLVNDSGKQFILPVSTIRPAPNHTEVLSLPKGEGSGSG